MRMEKLGAVEAAIRVAFEARFPSINSTFLLTQSKELANQRSAMFAAVIIPYSYFDEGGWHLRQGARWILHVPNMQKMSLTTREQLISIVLDEMDEYIAKGSITNDETSIHILDDIRYRLQRSTNRTIN